MNYKCLIPALASLILIINIAAVYGQDTSKSTKNHLLKNSPVAGKPANGAAPAKYVYHQPLVPIVLDTLADKTLKGQYNQVLTKVFHYQQPIIIWWYKNYMDTLNSERHKLKEAQAKLAKHQDTLAVLKNDNGKLAAASNTDTISILGISLSKSTYNITMWGLVLILGISLAVIKYLSQSNKHEAEYRTKLYEELSAEYQTYKVKANDKEKKLARELQTERNKLDELKNK